MVKQKRKSLLLLLGIFIAYAGLVATHEGEFWPFSIYPMFSQAGHPWTRSFVRDVTDETRKIEFKTQTMDELYGDPFILNSVEVHQNDLSNFISKNKDWSESRKNAVRSYFKDELDTQKFLIYKINGRLEGSEVAISYKPVIYLDADTTLIYMD